MGKTQVEPRRLETSCDLNVISQDLPTTPEWKGNTDQKLVTCKYISNITLLGQNDEINIEQYFELQKPNRTQVLLFSLIKTKIYVYMLREDREGGGRRSASLW